MIIQIKQKKTTQIINKEGLKKYFMEKNQIFLFTIERTKSILLKRYFLKKVICKPNFHTQTKQQIYNKQNKKRNTHTTKQNTHKKREKQQQPQ